MDIATRAAIQVEESVDISILYKNLKEMAATRPFNQLDLFVRLRRGIYPKHSENILNLYFFHLAKTDPVLYKKLSTAKDDQEMKQLLDGKVMKSYQGAVRSLCIFSDLFTDDFLQIINAYLDYVEKL